jgi:hypothetical protein
VLFPHAAIVSSQRLQVKKICRVRCLDAIRSGSAVCFFDDVMQMTIGLIIPVGPHTPGRTGPT